MIPGNIDLTRNLDFRTNPEDRSKPKKFSPIPWERVKEKVNELRDNVIALYNNFNSTSWTSLTNTSSSSTINTTYSINYGNNYTYSGTIQYDMINPDDINWYSINIDQDGATNITYWPTGENNNYISLRYTGYSAISNNGLYYTDEKASIRKHLKELFGEKKKPVYKSIIRYCSKCNKNIIGECRRHKNSYSVSDAIPWKSEKNRYKYFANTRVRGWIDDEFPWDDKNLDKYEGDNLFWISSHKKCQKIPWLEALDYRIRSDYYNDLHEEQDYSSYLTNMGWLGLH